MEENKKIYCLVYINKYGIPENTVFYASNYKEALAYALQKYMRRFINIFEVSNETNILVRDYELDLDNDITVVKTKRED